MFRCQITQCNRALSIVDLIPNKYNNFMGCEIDRFVELLQFSQLQFVGVWESIHLSNRSANF